MLFALSPIDDSNLAWAMMAMSFHKIPKFCPQPLTLRGKFCEICLKPNHTVKHAKHWLALRMPGLKASAIYRAWRARGIGASRVRLRTSS